jgi:integrase
MAKRPKLAEAVRERGNSRSLVVRYQGRQFSQVVHTKTKREAQAMLPAFVASVINGEHGRKQEAARSLASAPTIREAVEVFQRDYLRQDVDGEATRRFYGYALGLLAKQIGDRRVGDVTTSELQRVLRELHRSGRSVPGKDGSTGLAIASMKPIHAVISRFFNQLVEDGVIPTKPVPHFSKLNLGRSETPSVRDKSLSRGQMTALLDACTDDGLKLWVQIMAATGARPGEALALRWGDVGQDTLHIAGSVKPSGVHGVGRIGSTKTAGSVRTIPIGTSLALALAAERGRQETLLRDLSDIPVNVAPLQPLLQPGDCVFPADLAERRDAPVSMGAVRGRFQRAASRAGVDATPHWGRHTAITAMVAGDGARPGVSLVDAAKLAGHKNAMTTARTYAHALPENLRRGVALADDLIATSGRACHQTNQVTDRSVRIY